MSGRPTSNPSRPYVFGPFAFDEVSGELSKHGIRMRLQGQPLQILATLVRQPGQLISRDEFQQQLWSSSTFVDFEHGLNAAMNRLRQVLGDSADQPRYIETVPGRGYRFIAAVNDPDSGPVLMMPQARSLEEEPEAEVPPLRPSRFHFPSRTAAVLGLAVLVLAGVFVALRSMRSRPLESNSALQTTRFRIGLPEGMKFSGSQTFSVSPDGRTVVYHALGTDGIVLLWAQSLDALEPRVLPGTRSSSDAPVFWSPDSKFLAFYSDQTLKKLDLAGNPPQAICPAPSIVLGGSWNSEGTILFGTETSGILRCTAKNGEVTPMVTRNAGAGERVIGWPSFLPDGRHFLYSRLSSITENSGVFVGSLDAGPGKQNLKRLIETPLAAQFVASPDGNDLVLFQRQSTLWAQVFDVSRMELSGEPKRVVDHVGSHRAFGFFGSSSTGALVYRSAAQNGQPTWFDRRGRPLNSVGQSFDISEESPHLSPDGTRLAVAKFEGDNVDVWVHDLARDVSQRITFDPAIDELPIWSPDGKRIVFSAARSGHYDLYQIGAGGEGREELLYSSNENKFATSWSADGRFLLYNTEDGSANRGIWVLPMQATGDRTPVQLLRTRAYERAGVFSPDSRWIASVSNESGTPGVYLQPFSFPPGSSDGRPKILLSRDGGTAPHWRADGKEIFYRALDGTLMSVAVTTGGAMHPGVPQSLFHLPGTWWDVSSDGDRFLVGVPAAHSVPPFTVVLNWQAELKK